jgi:ribosomal-protein-alanine N-acetyltransferase
MKRLNANADVRNVASNRVLEKCGFTKEGTVRQGKMVSTYCDYNIYGLLDEDVSKSSVYNKKR